MNSESNAPTFTRHEDGAVTVSHLPWQIYITDDLLEADTDGEIFTHSEDGRVLTIHAANMSASYEYQGHPGPRLRAYRRISNVDQRGKA